MIDPTFILDSREEFHPTSVEDAVALTNWTPYQQRRFLSGLVAPGARLDFPPGMKQPAVPVVGYRRIKLGSPMNYDQRWLFYPYNPGPPRLHGIGRHEGDWEMVQVGYSKHDLSFEDPIHVTASRHGQAGKRDAWMIKGWPERLTIYVALGSHANYFTPEDSVQDEANGKGLLLPIEWREFGPWHKWPHKWGNSDNSPGPLTSRTAWNSPHTYHAAAK